MNLANHSAAPTTSPRYASNDDMIAFLKAKGLPLSVRVEDGLAVIDGYLTSSQAAGVLKPLGRRALGTFRSLPDNMVAIDTIVTLKVAQRMMAALRS